jgi:hypothetical protein
MILQSYILKASRSVTPQKKRNKIWAYESDNKINHDEHVLSDRYAWQERKTYTIY